MSKPLDRFPAIRTRNVDEMRAAVIAQYQVSDMVFPEGTQNFVGYTNHVNLRHISLSFGSYSIPVQVFHEGIDFVRQQFCINGAGLTTAEEFTTEVSAMQSCVTPAHTPVMFGFGPTFEHLVLRIPQTMLERKLASLLGTYVHPALEFKHAVPMDTAKARHLKNIVRFMVQSLDENGLAIPQHALDELEQMMAMVFLYGVRNSASGLLEHEVEDIAPWQVRRVEEYIEANWSTAVTIEILAEAINASARSIFKTFADHRGYSPMEFLRKVRLRQARSMLSAPNAVTTVTAVGLACGFVNLGHFARYYQAAFGELPSETLARAKGGDIRHPEAAGGSGP
jgi:AraC-like DNA-binding protein